MQHISYHQRNIKEEQGRNGNRAIKKAGKKHHKKLQKQGENKEKHKQYFKINKCYSAWS